MTESPPIFDEIWTEKYRPSTLPEIIGHEAIVGRLSAFIRARSIPHMLFAGPAGVGKTTAAICLAKDLFGDDWRENFSETNASDERGIDVVRNKVKDFARTKALGGGFKIIFLDECDALTQDAQNALRRTMENYTRTCRFVLSCNYSNKIIPPIQSRCAVFRFKRLDSADIRKYIERIVKCEKLKLADDGVEALIDASEGDLRRVTNLLQSAAAMSASKISAEDIYSAAQKASRKDVSQLLMQAVRGDFIEARESLGKLLIGKGLAGEDVLKQMHELIQDIPGVSERNKVRLFDRLGEYDFRMSEGADERIQLDAFLAQVALICSGNENDAGKENKE